MLEVFANSTSVALLTGSLALEFYTLDINDVFYLFNKTTGK